MNKNLNRFSLFTALIIVALGGCKRSLFYPGINTDPTKVSVDQLSGSPSVLLNGGENTIGYTVGGDVSRYTSTIVQSVRGYNRQFAAYDQYIYNAQDFNTVWANFYEGDLNNLSVLEKISDKNGYNFYSGISRVLLAYNFGLISDLWGDVPVFSALQGQQGIIAPSYDKQQTIYPYLQSLLDSAITELSGTAGGLTPGSDDVIYGGKASKWIEFAYGLKARYYLHLSKIDASYADNVLNVIGKAIGSSADNAAVPFYAVETSSNPWYQYIEQRSDILVAPTGNAVLPKAGSYLVDQMTAMNDARLPVFVNLDPSLYVVNTYFAGISAPVTLLSYTELLFIKAEALSAKGDPSAATVYSQAITQSFSDAGVSPGTYVTDNALTGADHPTRLPQIIKQKYFALFTSPEPFNDWRRTGYPALTPVGGAAQIPRRFLYSQNELDYNGGHVPASTTLYSKVWWDK